MQNDPHEPLVRPPRFLSRWYVWALTAAVLLVPFFVTIPVKLRKHPVFGPLGDQAHIPLLGAIMLFVYWKGPLRGRLWWATLAAAAIGALIEFVQLFVGRAALFGDWLLDLVGIGIVLGFVLWRGLGSRLGLALMAILILTVPWNLRGIPEVIRAREFAAKHFPVLDDFASPATRILWDDTDAGEMGFADVEDGPTGKPVHVLTITGAPPRTWPGARMIQFPFDWSRFSKLMVRVRHTGSDSALVSFTTRVDDFAGRKQDARFTTSFLASRQWQTFSMPLPGRLAHNCDHIIDLSDIETAYIYLPKPTRKATLQVDKVWLE